jgi:hypothetical protein
MITYCDELNVDRVEELDHCAREVPVTLWTLQNTEAVKKLKAEGHFEADAAFVFPDGETLPGKRRASEWMQAEMRTRLSTPSAGLPVWALVAYADVSHCKKKPKDILLRLEVPRKRILLTFHKPWTDILYIMMQLDANEGRWPTEWPLSLVQPYIPDDEEDRDQSLFLAPPSDSPRPRRFQFDEGNCRASWNNIFDMSLARRPGFLWRPIVLQAVLPEIFWSDVRCAIPYP